MFHGLRRHVFSTCSAAVPLLGHHGQRQDAVWNTTVQCFVVAFCTTFYDPCSMVALAGHSLYQRRSSNWILHQRGLMASPVAIQCARYPCTRLVAPPQLLSPSLTSPHLLPSIHRHRYGLVALRFGGHTALVALMCLTPVIMLSRLYTGAHFIHDVQRVLPQRQRKHKHNTLHSSLTPLLVHRWWEVQHWGASFCGYRRAPTCCTTAWVPGMSPCLRMMQQLLRQGGCCVVPWVSQLPLCGSCSWCFWHAAHSAAASKLPASEKPLKALGSSVVR